MAERPLYTGEVGGSIPSPRTSLLVWSGERAQMKPVGNVPDSSNNSVLGPAESSKT